jgi:hypothetical protein
MYLLITLFELRLENDPRREFLDLGSSISFVANGKWWLLDTCVKIILIIRVYMPEFAKDFS